MVPRPYPWRAAPWACPATGVARPMLEACPTRHAATPPLRPGTLAVTAGRPAARARQPAERADHDGVHVRRGRRPGVRPLRQPDLVGLRGGARRAGGRPLPGVRLRPRGRLDRARPRRPRPEGGRAAARLQRQRHAAGRPRGPRPDQRRAGRRHRHRGRSSRPATDAALVWLESPTNPALEVADLPPIIAAAHEAGAYVVVDNTFATPAAAAAARRSAPTWSCTRRRSSSPATATCCSGRVVTRDDELYGVLQEAPRPARRRPRHVRGVARAARPAHAARAAGAGPGERRRSWYAGCTATRRSSEVRYPGLRGDRRRSCWPQGALAADLLTRKTTLWVHATSLGGVESTFERRRRWKSEPATIPDGLVRMSVGIEDVDDLWDDLAGALDG